MSRLIETLKRHEGSVKSRGFHYVYKDHLGYATLGYGRCVEDGVGIGISDEEADFLLSNDIDRCNRELRAMFGWFEDLNEVRQEAIINLCFNMGLTKLRQFKMAIAAMEARDYERASDEFLDSLYAKQVGKRADEVAEMIRTGQYQD